MFILLGYITSVLLFLGIALYYKEVKTTPRLVFFFTVISLFWPIALFVYFLDQRVN